MPDTGGACAIGKRIAIVYDCAYPFVAGGGQKRLFEIARRLVVRGWAVDWYALKSWSEPGSVTVDGVRFIPAAPDTALYDAAGKRLIGETLYFGRATMRLTQLRHYDIVHIGQWPYFHFFPIRLFAAFGKARVSADWWEVWGREWVNYYGVKGYLGMALEFVCAHLPSKLIAISDIGAQQLRGLGIPARRLRTIHNGIDWERLREGPIAPTGSALIYLGRLQPHKNVNLLIDALALLRARGLKLDLAVIGDGQQRAALEAQVTALGLVDQVQFHGAIADDDAVYALLRAAKIFVHPSTKEGGGSITSLEANAAGAQVVAFRCVAGLSPELIEPGINGRWVEKISASALADTIADLWANEDWQASRRRAQEFSRGFDWESLAEQYHDFFLDNCRA